MKNIYSWLHSDLEVRDSKIGGKGIFAKNNLKKKTRLAIFGGNIMLIDEINNLPEEFQEYVMQIEERFVLGFKNQTEPELTDFFNHHCDPNAGFKGQIFLVAMRDIRKDEEVTFDYAMVASKSVGSDIVFEMDCNCGSKLCRKKITENDWKLPELRERYQGYFSQYIEDKIENRE